MKPTAEQKAIIDTPLAIGESLMVEAGAGTGKTSCFIEFSKSRPDQRLLYICFNTKGAAEAREKYAKEGITNTTASTIHGLARATKAEFEKAGKFQTKITAKEFKQHLSCTEGEASKTMAAIKNFCESNAESPSVEHLPLTASSGSLEQGRILKLTQEAWSRMVDLSTKFPISYDHYLKVYQLQKKPLKYDYILLDEAQDCQPMSLKIVEQASKSGRVILIGDENQAIYAWRGAKNAMRQWTPTKTLGLTESFRFGPEIAKVANLVLANFQKHTRRITGHRDSDSVGPLPDDIRHTLIARTNASLFEAALAHAQTKKRVHFVGTTAAEKWDPSIPYKFEEARDVYRLWIGDRHSVKTPHLKVFDNYSELKRAATGKDPDDRVSYQPRRSPATPKAGDKELESLCNLVEKYKHRLPELLTRIIETSTSPFDADMLLVTAHRSKGLEWPLVKLADDFAPPTYEHTDPQTKQKKVKLVECVEEESLLQFPWQVHREEFNLLYVAATRAQQRVDLPANIYTLMRNPSLLSHTPTDQLPKLTPSSVTPPQPLKQATAPVQQAAWEPKKRVLGNTPQENSSLYHRGRKPQPKNRATETSYPSM
jgi:hypothetical protein